MLGESIEIPYITYSGGVDVKTEWSRALLSGRSQELRRNNYPADPEIPYLLKISHQEAGKGLAIRDRHMLRFETKCTTADDVETGPSGALYVVADFPRQNFSALQKEVLWKQLTGFLLNGSAQAAVDASAKDLYTHWHAGLLV